jgi:hypothetical protein
LRLELVAGEAENFNVLGVLRLKLLVELLETLELRGEAALGGGVDGENDLAFQRGEGEGLALFCLIVKKCVSWWVFSRACHGPKPGLQEQRTGGGGGAGPGLGFAGG